MLIARFNGALICDLYTILYDSCLDSKVYFPQKNSQIVWSTAAGILEKYHSLQNKTIIKATVILVKYYELKLDKTLFVETLLNKTTNELNDIYILQIVLI